VKLSQSRGNNPFFVRPTSFLVWIFACLGNISLRGCVSITSISGKTPNEFRTKQSLVLVSITSKVGFPPLCTSEHVIYSTLKLMFKMNNGQFLGFAHFFRYHHFYGYFKEVVSQYYIGLRHKILPRYEKACPNAIVTDGLF